MAGEASPLTATIAYGAAGAVGIYGLWNPNVLAAAFGVVFLIAIIMTFSGE